METYASLEQEPADDAVERSSRPHARPSLARSLLDERTMLSDPELLRGAPFPVVVAGFGQLLEPTGTIAASDGALSTEDTFVYSRKVDVIHHFLSHSWRDSAKLKWLSLLFYMNFTSAMIAGHLFAAIAFAIVYVKPNLYPFPGITVPANEDTGMAEVTYRFGPFILVLFVVFFCSIFVGHFVTREKSDLFLDKICIHQTDPDLKAAGIQSLGAFLKRSENLLVLWGEDYFDRLWCSYELALYIRLNGTSAVRIMPIDSAAFLTALALGMTYTGIAVVFLDASLVGITALIPAMFPYAGIGVYKAKLYEARQRLLTMLSDYDVRQTVCYCCQVNHVLPDGRSIPCDRKFVEDSIAAWYGDGTGNGLDNFNEAVRTQLREGTSAILGQETVSSFASLVLICSVSVWEGMGQGLINPWNANRFKVGTLIETIVLPFCFSLIDVSTGIIMKKLWQCNSRGIWFRCWTGLVFFVLFTPVTSMDAVFLNERTPLGTLVIIALSLIGLGMLARYFAP
eukprot:TRINITY_DN11291_c0_g2_i1.p1 TRINITY_DN11291_c0_g2~~TRINITY_DN11291_c0_g2_i1.p1  ORF type:complete len:511 (+),score=26.94 TRINITY_DN11291_c0_g2_i1:61-1593(+)